MSSRRIVGFVQQNASIRFQSKGHSMITVRIPFVALRRFRSVAVVLSLTAVLIGNCHADGNYVVEENLIYGRVNNVDLKLDLARPKEGNGPFPAIVFIHGGAWAGGERKSYRSLIQRAADKGYVAVQISYRLTEPDPVTHVAKVPFPAQIHDCKCAVRWLRSVADTYQINKNRIGVTGGSAGGHLSLLVGLVDDAAGLEGDGGHSEFSSDVNAVVNYCGPTDLAREFKDVEVVQPFLIALCGGKPEEAAESYRRASPVSWLSPDDPPVLTLHGDQDDIVPVSQARLLDDAMKKAGLSHELIVLEGQGHAFMGESGKRAEAALWAFFEKHLKDQAKP
jgi:acetyl esterase/lipase